MPVPTSIDDLSTTAGSNSPSGADSPGDGDNYIRAHGAFIATLRDKLDGTSDSGIIKNATFSGTMAGAASWSGLQTFAAGIETTAPNGKVYGSTYTPTFTEVANITTLLDLNDFTYVRLGNVVSVSGKITVLPFAAALTRVGISLPVASALTSSVQLHGVCAYASTGMVGDVVGDATNDRAELRFTATGAVAEALSFNFSYVVI